MAVTLPVRIAVWLYLLTRSSHEWIKFKLQAKLMQVKDESERFSSLCAETESGEVCHSPDDWSDVTAQLMRVRVEVSSHERVCLGAQIISLIVNTNQWHWI